MANTGAMIGKQHQIRNSPVSIALANSPYTVSANISEVNVNTAGGNVRVNLPNSARKITVNKTSSDSYLVTLYVAGTQIGEIAGERSSVTIESGQITKDEPWYPYDMMVQILGISGDGGEIVAKNRFGKCLSSTWRGVAGTDDATIAQVAIDLQGKIQLTGDTLIIRRYLEIGSDTYLCGNGKTILKAASDITVAANLPCVVNCKNPTTIGVSNVRISDLIIDANKSEVVGSTCGGLGIRMPNYLWIERVVAKNAKSASGMFVLLRSGAASYNDMGQYSWISDCSSHDNDWAGIEIETDWATVSNCHVYSNLRDGMRFEQARYCIAQNIHAISNGWWGVGVVQDGYSHTFTNIESKLNSQYGMSIEDCIGCTITGIDLQSNAMDGIYLLNANTDLNISQGKIASNNLCGIRNPSTSTTAGDITISGLKIAGNGQDGIQLVNESQGSTVISRVISRGNHQNGMFIQGGSNWGRISNCLIYENFRHGIYFWGTGGTTEFAISNNTLYNNSASPHDTYSGIYFANGANYVSWLSVIGNKIAGLNHKYCIESPTGDYPTIEGNRFGTGTTGILTIGGNYQWIKRNRGYATEKSDSSIGTGSEQTIPHGLAAIPTGCKAWIRYPISATVYAEKEIRMDATNIYPKVKTGLAYDWRVE